MTCHVYVLPILGRLICCCSEGDEDNFSSVTLRLEFSKPSTVQKKHTNYIVFINAFKYTATSLDFLNDYSNFSLLISKVTWDLKEKQTSEHEKVKQKRKVSRFTEYKPTGKLLFLPRSSLSFSLFHISLQIKLQVLWAIVTLNIIKIRNVHC